MSYVYPQTSLTFVQRDNLAQGQAEKVIIGLHFEAEFEAIESAFINTLPKNNPAFTGTLTGPNITITGTLEAGLIDGGSYSG